MTNKKEESLHNYFQEKDALLKETLQKLKPDEVCLHVLKDIYLISNYEILVIEKILERKTNREIADELDRNRPAIDNLINKSILKKLNVSSKFKLIDFVQSKLGLHI